ncbi:replication protein RepA [Cupriavidus oxalaticus]|uniref:RepA replicase n=1 Tax=Cupriavidus oxalaticus TaxID=96344 RepID=A0A4P7LU74_9BURK|nr:replication protein RepA [Cupriavidus oxalaticus]QBY56167.1 RepA replicase [Cupriavidus oxalaticus]
MDDKASGAFELTPSPTEAPAKPKRKRIYAPRSAVSPAIDDRLVTEARAIEAEDAFRAGMTGYMGRTLVQATLPYREPLRSLEVWERTVGKTSLIIKQGHAKNRAGKWERIGYPYGSYPRLMLAWIGAEVVRTKERTIVLGDSLAAFMAELGIGEHRSGGKNGARTRLRDQMMRLFLADISAQIGGASVEEDLQLQKLDVAENANLFWSTSHPGQAGLWQSTILLGERFFEETKANPVPVDLRALRALRSSPMALDLYCWMTYRNFSLAKSTTVPWDALHEQFGSETKTLKKFRENFLPALKKVLTVYPQAKVEPKASGLYMEPSKTSVPRRIKDW